MSGVCLWLISTCRQAARGGGSGREREPSGNKGRIVWGYKTVPCGCQENKVLVKPIRDGPFSSWYWLLLAGYGRHMGTFMRQLLKWRRKEHASDVQWRHSTLVEKSKDWKLSGCFHTNVTGLWVGAHHDYICPQMFLVPWRSHTQSHMGFSGEILVVSGGKPMFSNSTKRSLWVLFIN